MKYGRNIGYDHTSPPYHGAKIQKEWGERRVIRSLAPFLGLFKKFGMSLYLLEDLSSDALRELCVLKELH